MSRKFLLKFKYVERSYQESHYDKFLFEIEDDFVAKRIDAYQFLIKNNPRTVNESLVRIMFLLPKDPDLPDGYDTSTYSLSLSIHGDQFNSSRNRLQLRVMTNEKEYQPLLDIYNDIDEFKYLSDIADELMRFLDDIRHIIDGLSDYKDTNFSSSDNWIDIENFRIYISTIHIYTRSPLHLITNEFTRIGASKYELNLNYNWKIFVRDSE